MKLTLIWRVVALTVIPFSVTAQSDEGLAECAAVEDTLLRLACYDELASSAGLEPPPVIAIPEAYADRSQDTPERAAELPATGEWMESVERDSDGDPTAVSLSSWAIAGASTEGYAISMTISCRRGRTSLSVRWVDYLGSWTEIATRIGVEPAGTREWNLSGDGRSAFYPGRTLAFIENMAEAGSVSFEVTPYSKRPVIADFDTSGLGDALAPWRQMCRR
jgi:type VI secretion system protein VasI